MPDGTFSVSIDGLLKVLDATPDGYDVLRRTGLLIERLLDEGLEPGAVIERVSQEVSPEVASRLPKDKAGLRRVSMWVAGAIVAGALAAGGADAYKVAKSAVVDTPASDRREDQVQMDVSRGSEGVIRYPDGMVVRWGPGTRPTVP